MRRTWLIVGEARLSGTLSVPLMVGFCVAQRKDLEKEASPLFKRGGTAPLRLRPCAYAQAPILERPLPPTPCAWS